jgi:predicted dehydrogenase
MKPLRIAVVGVGHLGKEHARILAGLSGVELVGVADINFDQAQQVARRVGTQAFGDYWPLLNLVDAASIVVPTTQHHAIASEFLRRGIPLLVEKPLAGDPVQAEDLVRLAKENDVILQVGHIERFNAAFEDVQQRPLQPKFVTCERLGPYTGRSTDIGVVHDLMIHDLDLLLALVKSPVTAVEAIGVSVFGGHEDVAHARLRFANGCLANVTASRVSAAPVRRMHIWAPEGYVGIDFQKRRLALTQPAPALQEHRRTPKRPEAVSRFEDAWFDHDVRVIERDRNGPDQLTRELQHFVDAVRHGTRPRVTGVEATAALALAERILDSLRCHRWDGSAGGPTGPHQIPVPLGSLFTPLPREEVA